MLVTFAIAAGHWWFLRNRRRQGGNSQIAA
jgi:hypothetical protein